MHKYQISILLFMLLLQIDSYGQCPAGEDEIRLEIDTDYYWDEVKWTIKDLNTSFQYVEGTVPNSGFNTFTYCLPQSCKLFKISDSNGDGITPDGYYRIFLNDVLIHETPAGFNYYAGETVKFGCPPGTSCESAFPVDTGIWATPTGEETWYRFVPAENGIYQINTCSPLNACGSKIWVYGQCEDIVLTNNLVGSDFYAEDGCENGALASLFLGNGQDYFIRIRSEPNNCDTTPIHFTLTYIGPITGCTDPVACNYNPLATVSDTCIYPGNPNCPQKPDFAINQEILHNSLVVTSLENPDICTVEEGCLRGLGIRDVIRFTTHITNIGDDDFYIGETPDDNNTPSTQFIWDPCHHHWHYQGYAEYVLFDANGLRIPIGSKAGFCVFDGFCSTGDQKYTCINMGISKGCGDAYGSGTDCQWIDITDLPAGDYTLVVRVNWDKSPDLIGRVEASYDNNWAQACFNLSYSGENPDVVFNFDQCPAYTDCTGAVFGDAQPDCNGVCNGPSLRGDIDQDTTRNQVDMEQYLAIANSDNGDASTCLDLDGNGQINLYDEALLQECVIHQDDPQYWIQRFPCQFPGGVNNLQDLVMIQPAALDTVNKTFDLEIINPFGRMLGYEFNVSGLVIDSIENLMAGYDPNLRFNPANNEIIGMGINESSVKKNALPLEFLRIHYAELTDTAICVSAITAVVNEKYQLSNASIGNPSCITVVVSGTNEIEAPFGVYVQPNPFTGHTTVFFENESADLMTVTLNDITGRVIRSFEGVRDNSVTFERGNLEAGTYFFTVSGAKGRVTGKVMAQ